MNKLIKHTYTKIETDLVLYEQHLEMMINSTSINEDTPNSIFKILEKLATLNQMKNILDRYLGVGLTKELTNDEIKKILNDNSIIGE